MSEPKKIQRYYPECAQNVGFMEESEHGEYVKWEDYKALQDKIDNLETEKEGMDRPEYETPRIGDHPEIPTVEELAFDWSIDYKPWETDLPYQDYAYYGFWKGYLRAIEDWEEEKMFEKGGNSES